MKNNLLTNGEVGSLNYRRILKHFICYCRHQAGYYAFKLNCMLLMIRTIQSSKSKAQRVMDYSTVHSISHYNKLPTKIASGILMLAILIVKHFFFFFKLRPQSSNL